MTPRHSAFWAELRHSEKGNTQYNEMQSFAFFIVMLIIIIISIIKLSVIAATLRR